MTILNEQGFRVWDEDSTNPFERRMFVFSMRSAAQAWNELKAVRGFLQTAVRLPDADYDGRKIIEQWLRNHPDSKPIRSPFPVYLRAHEWYWISRALREWQLDGNTPYEYNVMVRAKKRGMEYDSLVARRKKK